jgi:hypothetical protein
VILALKTQMALLTAPFCIINKLSIGMGQPMFGLLLALAVKYHVTKALPWYRNSKNL